MKFFKLIALPLFLLSFSLFNTTEANAQGVEVTIDPGTASPFFEGRRLNKDCNGSNQDTWGTQFSGTAIFWPASFDTYIIEVCDAFGVCDKLGPVGSGYPQSVVLSSDKVIYHGFYPCVHPTVIEITP